MHKPTRGTRVGDSVATGNGHFEMDRSNVYGDRFVVKGQAGRGGMGLVYRAFDLHTGRMVALKVLDSDKTASSADRFIQEAAVLAELRHPAIVRYVAHGVTSHQEHYLAMEWLEGETLEDRLKRGPIPVLQALRLGLRITDALAAAHSKGVVHRDLKPSNLFLPGGEVPQVTLLDFGIARKVSDARRITRTGATLGTPTYMSPEQARGAKRLDGRSDLFSLGALLFECLTGQAAFAGEGAVVVMTRICLETIDLEARCGKVLPAPIIDLLGTLLARDLDKRPASAAALKGQLSSLVQTLAATGLEDAAGDERAPKQLPSPVLTSDEQRILSAIVIAQPSPPLSDDQLRAGESETSDVSATAATAQAAASPPQDLRNPASAAVEAIAELFGGRVDTVVGDALLVTLTGRHAARDSATQAARCALRLQTIVPGAVIALSTGRGIAAGTYPLGEVVDRAARLLYGETPGVICLDEATADLLDGRFEIARSEGGCRLLFERNLKEAPRKVLGVETPCVGRDREIEDLEALFGECVNEPVGRAVLFTSPPGGGKSRLLHEFAERVLGASASCITLTSRGDSLRAGTPLGMLAPALRSAAGISLCDSEHIQRLRLSGHVARHVRPEEQKRVVAFLGEMVGLPFADDDLPALRAARRDPRMMADQVLAAWLDWLEAECAAHPVVLVLEDLHWGDLPSVQFVATALRTLRERPFMVLAFARPEIDEKFPGLWADRDVRRIPLPPLTAKASEKLALSVLGNLGPEKIAAVVKRAAGNPLYLEELLRTTAANKDPENLGALPDTLLGVLQARLDAQGERAKQILRAASIFGQSFETSGLRTLLDDTQKDLDEWLAILCEREVIFPCRAGDSGEYAFRHGLMRDAAYEMLTSQDRRLGHNLAGRYLQRAGVREAIVLVEHFERGGDLVAAAHHCRQAAAQALDANDLNGAVERARRGVRLGSKGEALGALRLIEAQALFWLGDFADAERAAREALGRLGGQSRFDAIRTLVSALGQQAKFDDVAACAEAIDRDPAASEKSRAASRIMCASYLVPAGRLAEVEAILAEIEGVVDIDPSLVGPVYFLRASLAAATAKEGEAVRWYESALHEFEEKGDLRSSLEAQVCLASILCDIGAFEEAEALLHRARTNAARLNFNYVLTAVAANLAFLHVQLGRPRDATDFGNQARELARKQGDFRVVIHAENYLARAALLEGQYSRAAQHAGAALELSPLVPNLAPAVHATLARTFLAENRLAEAIAHAREAAEKLEAVRSIPEGEALVHLTLIECLLAAGDGGVAALLDIAHERLLRRASGLGKLEWQHSFLTRIPEHARMIELAREHGGSIADNRRDHDVGVERMWWQRALAGTPNQGSLAATRLRRISLY